MKFDKESKSGFFVRVCVWGGGGGGGGGENKEGDRMSDRIKVSKYSLYTILYKISSS